MYKKIFFAFAAGLFITIPLAAHALSFNIWDNTTKTVTYASGTMLASTTANCNVTGSCNLCDALQVFKNIVNILFTIAIPLAVALIVYGGIRVMTSGGSEQNVSEAKNIITSALIGLVIALAAWVIVSVILSVIAQSSFPTTTGGSINFMFWNDITCTM
jgi:hypothetical protein